MRYVSSHTALWRLWPLKYYLRTGVLIIENALSLFHTQYLARRNYSAEMTEILHGTLLGHSAWDSRGIFAISVWGPRYGVPLGSWGGPKILKNFFFQFFHFFQQEWVHGHLNS